MYYRSILTLGFAGLSSGLGIPTQESTCQTQSQPNPIAQQYADQTTGTVNGTVVILPIPYSLARATIPKQYPILKNQYQEWLPNLGEDMYPAVFNGLLDHDIQMASLDFHVPDFSRAVLQFPFVDRLNDGYTAMQYGPQILISANLIAIVGSTLYGEKATASTFDPPCDAYTGLANGSTSFIATPIIGGEGARTLMSELGNNEENPYSLAFLKNITNQPTFGNAPIICDNFIRLYNTSLTEGQFAPKSVKGSVSIAAPYAPVSSTWTSVYGYEVDTPFIEKNAVPCTSLQGYSGTGSGD